MQRPAPEPVQVIKQRRDAALSALVSGVPYMQYLGVRFDRRGDELTALLPFDDKLIGNPMLPAIHGGVTAAFLEITAMVTLNWSYLWQDIESGALDPDSMTRGHCRACPRPSTLPSTTCARACRATPMGAPASPVPGGATPASRPRPGRTTATAPLPRPMRIS
ncbi:hypothetical protein KU6B_12810 [Mameliella alba]|nr:hypothetical protein KU6B_12810 [Mameliella alba]